MSGSERIFGSAKVVALCTLLSRITGLARDIALNAAFGQNWVQDAFNYGFQIPNLFRRLFGEGALAAVFVPTFTEVLERDGRPAAWVLLGRITGLLVLALTVLTLLLEGVVLVVWWLAPSQAMRGLMIGLTSVMLPFVITICLLALFSSILNCLNHFAAPALAPIVLNLGSILGILVVGPAMSPRPEVRVYGVALSVLVAGVFQLLMIYPVLRRYGVSFRLSLGLGDDRVRRVLRSFMPVFLGQGILLINVYLDAQICSFLTRGPQQPPSFSLAGHSIDYPLADGALSAVTNAARLYQFPLGVLAISLATAAFPTLSQFAARGDLPNLRATVGSSFRLAVFEGLPSGLLMIVLAEPIVSLLFEYGRYGPEQTARAAAVLRWYGIGMWAFCAQHIIIRGFYSLKDTLTPMWIGCSLVLLNQVINLTLIWHPAIREAAFGIGTSATASIYVLVGLLVLRRRTGGRIGARRMLASLIRSLGAGLLATLAAYALMRGSASLVAGAEKAFASRLLSVFMPLGGGLLVYLAAARALGMEEVAWVVGRKVRSV